MFKILDCTLRDGGYYTNWDFDKELVNTYIKALNHLPVDYIELGYRSAPMKEYFGKYFYCPVYELQELRKLSNKKLVIILNEKDVMANDAAELLQPIKGLVDMVRVAIDPQNFNRALLLAAEIKKLGFEVGFNVMYMSKWKQYAGFIDSLSQLDGLVDYFYMVDSYGGVYPDDVKETMGLVRAKTKCKLGFHGHNNLELALINSLTAIENGADMIDATILGMGRGAGNLKTELLLSVLNSKYKWDIDFNAIGNVVDGFKKLLDQHQWGTNVPYMISGSNSLPQKDVMDWVTTRLYSFNSIIRALQNQKNKVKDNEQFPVFKPKASCNKVLIIGGGPNAVEHSQAISQFIKENADLCIIHASSKNASLYVNLPVQQYFCLVGSEGHRLEKVFNDFGQFHGECVLPPYPRKMGTYVPASVRDRSFEIEKIDFTDKITDSHTVLALQIAIALEAKKVYMVGYDGYHDADINEIQRTLVDENEYLFNEFEKYTGVLQLNALTPSTYKTLKVTSIYSII